MFRKEATIGELYEPAMQVQTEAEAAEYLGRLINWAVTQHGQTPEQARSIQLQNLGYFAGYYNSATMERVNRLYNTRHPIFGSITPTAKQALSAGMEAARK